MKNKSGLIIKLSYLLIGSYFIHLLLTALMIGGMWDLNEQIAIGDRFVNGVGGYANGIDDLFIPSSPYFPGVGLISASIQYLGISNLYLLNQVMLFLAISISAIYFYLLTQITLKFRNNLSRYWLTTIMVILFIIQLRVYKSYMIEFKPDTILLVFASTIFLILERQKKQTIASISFVILLLFVSVFFKQSSFLVYFLAFFLVVFHQQLSKKQKLIIIGLTSISGIVAISLIFNIKNAYYACVQIMKYHSFVDLKTMSIFFLEGITANLIFIIFLIYFLCKEKYYMIIIKNTTTKYFLFALIWLIFAIISTMKIGGNSGNFEAGLVPFMPFVALSIGKLLERYFNMKPFQVLTTTILVALLLVMTYKIHLSSNNLQDSTKSNIETIKYLSSNYSRTKAFVDGNTFILAKTANISTITELETALHFNNVSGYDFSQLKQAIFLKKYGLIYLSQDYQTKFAYFSDKSILKIFQENYILYNDPSRPPNMYGLIYIPIKEQIK